MTEPDKDDFFSLRGRRALIIGGTRGIGGAIALRFARAGAEVIANYVRDDEAAERFRDAAAAESLPVRIMRGDASSDAGRERILQALQEGTGSLSVLVYAAATGVHKPIEQLSGRHFDFTFALNVRGFILLSQMLLPSMTRGSSIIALSSEGSQHAMTHYGLVGSSKAALESLCRQMAVEWATRGIRVNALSPGTVATDAWKVLPEAERRLQEAAARSPRGTLVTLDEIAASAQFLASGASSGISGTTLVVDGAARVSGAG